MQRASGAQKMTASFADFEEDLLRFRLTFVTNGAPRDLLGRFINNFPSWKTIVKISAVLLRLKFTTLQRAIDPFF